MIVFKMVAKEKDGRLVSLMETGKRQIEYKLGEFSYPPIGVLYARDSREAALEAVQKYISTSIPTAELWEAEATGKGREDEVGNGQHVKHRDGITFNPKEKVEGEVIEGPMGGVYSWIFSETPQGTRIDLSFDVEPRPLMFKIGFRYNGKKVMQGMVDEYNKQLSDYAEAHPRLRKA